MDNHKRLERLLKTGIPQSQLDKARTEFPAPSPVLDDTQFLSEESTGQVLIPLSKVVYAINRVDEKLSWFDNFIENSSYRQGEDGSFEVLLRSLETKGLEDFIASFQIDQENPITATYYEDFDTYIIGEGKHRATFAKVIGMSQIKRRLQLINQIPEK
jgi:hypothetical protein